MGWEYPGEGGAADTKARIFKRGGQVVLDSDGVSDVVFDPPIMLEREPYLVLTPRVTSSSAGLLAANVVDGSFTMNPEGRYTGCQITAARITKALPEGMLSIDVHIKLSGKKVQDKNDVTGEKVDWLAF